MKPEFRLLNKDLIDRIVSEGLEILMNPGVKVHNEETLKLLSVTCPHYLYHPLC